MLARIATLDALLQAHAAELGADHDAYRNHAYRVANFCLALHPNRAAIVEKAAIAAAFHDLGIWTDKTFDYLLPSMQLATLHLEALGKLEWIPEIRAAISEHHKLTRYASEAWDLVEPFRKADLVDLSRGAVSFGLPKDVLGEIFAAWPNSGFHRRLVELSARRFLTHPLSPLPMLKW